MSDVFISHSSKDKEIADKVVEYLESKGLACWIAPRNIVPGSDWAASISTAITASSVFLLIFSENSAASNQVARELSLAESKDNVFTVPYRVDNAELTGAFEYYLTSSHWIAADYAKKNYKLEELYALLAGITGKSVQNITNITNIDNLHIHTNGDPIAAAKQVGQEINAAASAPYLPPNPMPETKKPPANKQKMIRIGIIAGCVLAVTGIIAVVVSHINGKEPSSPRESSAQETAELSESTSPVSADSPEASAASSESTSPVSADSPEASAASSESTAPVSNDYGDFNLVNLINFPEADIIKEFGSNYTTEKATPEYYDHEIRYAIVNAHLFGGNYFSSLDFLIDDKGLVCAVRLGCYAIQSDTVLRQEAYNIYETLKNEFGTPSKDKRAASGNEYDYIYKEWTYLNDPRFPGLGDVWFYSSTSAWSAYGGGSCDITLSFTRETIK